MRLACARHLADLARAKADPAWPYVFDAAKADRVCRFIELLPHVKGDWAKRRETIRLEPWQAFILCVVFGWVHRTTGLRRFLTVYIEVPRKNAKSTLTSAVALYMLAADGEAGAECYSAATKKDQARIVFDAARAMALKCPEFRDRFGVDVWTHQISVPAEGSIFKPLDAQGSTQDGANVHFVGVDELHAHKTRAMFDVMETATGSRSQSILWIITTGGTNTAGICYEQRDYVTKILNGVFADETYFGIIYTLDKGDDWRDPGSLAKANPNLGVSVNASQITRLIAKAKRTPSAQNNVKTKHFNIWGGAGDAWMDMQEWNAAADPGLRLEDFAGEDCWQGIDLASKVDVASRVRVFRHTIDGRDHYYAFASHYVPMAAVEEEANAAYPGWQKQGHLIATPGNIIDIGKIEEDIEDEASRFTVRQIAYDPFQATQMATRLTAAGFEMVEVRPTVLNFSEPMKELEALVLDDRFHHDGDPVLAWMASNVTAELDRKDNIYPRKERRENKIDGIVALIMALSRAIADEEQGISIPENYEEAYA